MASFDYEYDFPFLEQEAKGVIMEARRHSRPVPSIVAHEYRDETQGLIAGAKGLRVPGSASGQRYDDQMDTPLPPAKVVVNV